MDGEKEKIIRIILGIESKDDRKSTLQLALKQARRLIGYNQSKASRSIFLSRRVVCDSDKEEILNAYNQAYIDEEMDVLTSLSLYLIVLDQLGHIFGERSSISNRVKDAIDKAKVPSGMNDRELEAIKELRDSINHNFGLASFSPKKGKGNIKFILCFDDDGNHIPVVDALNMWDGNWCDKDERTSVHIFPFSLINYIEVVVCSFVKQLLDGRLETPLTVEELQTRFTIKIKKT